MRTRKEPRAMQNGVILISNLNRVLKKASGSLKESVIEGSVMRLRPAWKAWLVLVVNFESVRMNYSV